MQSEDVLGLVAYDYEPEYSVLELKSMDKALDNTNIEEKNDEWCDCENCTEMASRDTVRHVIRIMSCVLEL